MTANADGSGPAELVSGAANIKGPNGLEFGNGKLFWPDQQLAVVSRANPDGTGPGVFVRADNPYDVFIGDKVYWTSQTGRYIDSADLNGQNVVRIHSQDTVTSPFAIEVTGSHIYWSEVSGSGRIRRSDLNGGNIVTIIDRAFTYDMEIRGEFLYFGDNNFPASIKRARLDGSGLTTVLPVDFVNGIWLAGEFIYWSGLDTIYRARADGSSPEPLYTAEPGATVRGVVVQGETGPVIAAPVLEGARRSGDDFIFSVRASAGQTVHIETNGSVAAAGWSAASSFPAGAAPASITNKITPGPARFFRARID